MKASRSHVLVLVTVPNRRVGRHLAGAILKSHAAACVSLVPGLESHYWWKGKLESGRELLLLMKTVKGKVSALEAIVRAEHPYDTPEFVYMKLDGGSARYLSWLDASVGVGSARANG